MSRWQDRFPWTDAIVRFVWPSGPARRKRWVKLAVFLLILVGAHAALTALAAVRLRPVRDEFTRRWGPLSVAEHRPPKVADAANRVRAVRAALEMMSLPGTRFDDDADSFQEYATGPRIEFTAKERDAIRKLVADNALAISLLDEAAKRTGSDWGLHYERGLELDIPPLLKIIQLSKLNAAAGLLALEDGRIDDALGAFHRGSALTHSLDNEPVLIIQLVRLAVERTQTRLLARILELGALDARRMETLRSDAPDVDPRKAMQQAMIVEAAVMLGPFRDGEEMPDYFGTVERILFSDPLRAVGRPYLLRQERLWLEGMSARIEDLETPRRVRQARSPESRLGSVDVLVRMMVKNIESVVERADMADVRNTLARTAIALQSRRMDTGHAPATLAELVPTYVPEVPIDPWTGRPFAYETNGTGWHLASEADISAVESAKLSDQLFSWSKP